MSNFCTNATVKMNFEICIMYVRLHRLGIQNLVAYILVITAKIHVGSKTMRWIKKIIFWKYQFWQNSQFTNIKFQGMLEKKNWCLP